MTTKAELERVLRAVPLQRTQITGITRGLALEGSPKPDYPALAEAMWALWEKETDARAERTGPRC